MIGQDRVGKTSVGRSLKGEKFKEDESSTEGVQVDIALKNADAKPWKNSTEEQEMTAFDHKCALYISHDLSRTKSPEREVVTGLEERMSEGPMADDMDGKTRLFRKLSVWRIFILLIRCHLYLLGLHPCLNFVAFDKRRKN